MPSMDSCSAGSSWARYMMLSLADRKTVCDVVVALAVAATVKAR